MDKPDWQPRWMVCARCDEKWRGWIPSFVPVAIFIAAVRAMRCPACHAGARRVAFDLARERAEPPHLDTPV